MKNNGTLTRRQFGSASVLGAAGLLASTAQSQDIETYERLGLHRPFEWSGEINGHSLEEFRRFLDPPEDAQYEPCTEAFPSEGTPRGEVRKFEGWSQSEVFPQTERDLWLYLPKQLSSEEEPPNLLVFQDGLGYVDPEGPVRAPAVLDTLIHAGDLRPTVGVFINPGRRLVARAASDPDRGRQRSVEYDTLSDAYVSFVLEEVEPFIEKELGGSLTRSPERRIICGISSGGICAFNSAWHRPNSFGRVLSHCGSFTNIRGGHNYPYLVRTTVRKPIRVFMTTGAMDLDIPIGSWPLANQQMAAALEYSGYDYRFEFSDGGHNLRHAGSIFADSLRWLMR